MKLKKKSNTAKKIIPLSNTCYRGKMKCYYLWEDKEINDNYCKYLEKWGIKEKQCGINMLDKNVEYKEVLFYKEDPKDKKRKRKLFDDFCLMGKQTF